MERVAQYRPAIKNILEQYARLLAEQPTPGVESLLIMDEARDQYLLLKLGWAQGRRVRSTVIHVRLHGGKVWIEEDWTEDGIATDLLRVGVPNDDIVLAFLPPEMRRYTEFAAV